MTESEFYIDTNAHLRTRVSELERELDAEQQRRFDGNRIASEEAREELAAVQARAVRMVELMRKLREPDWHLESIREFQRELRALEDAALSDDTALREMLEAARMEEREGCALACTSEYVDALGTGCAEDFAYNNALDHAAEAIRARGAK